MTKRRPHFWTDEKLKRLEVLVEEHKYTAAEMGRALGCTRHAVIGMAARRKLTLLPRKECHERKRMGVVRQQTPKPAPYIPPKHEDSPISLALEIEHLSNSSCHFPYGDNTPYTFCGHPVKSGAPYCDFHCRITRTPMMTNRAASDSAMVAQINSGGKRGMW